jgi:hypothetical protein
MAQNDPLTRTSNRKNTLIHEVHITDEFDVMEHKKQNEDANSIQPLTDSLQIHTAASNTRKNSMDSKLLNIGHSPSTVTASYFNSNFDENGYVFDGVKIDIEDIDNTSVSNITTQSLKRCKSQVLRHYYSLLCFIGWRPFYKEHYYRTPWYCRIFNLIYPLLIVSLLFYAYAYDILTCQGKLNIQTDTQSITAEHLIPAFTRNPNETPTSRVSNMNDLNPVDVITHLNQTKNSTSTNSRDIDVSNKKDDQQDVCGHIVTTYILPSLMHLIAYILGFVYFRINENEQLYALMEKVFLAVNQKFTMDSQDKVIKRLKIFIFMGVLWVAFAMSIHALFRATFGLEKALFEPSWASIFIDIIALVIVNSIYLAVVINYATQCEMIIFYIDEVRTRLEEKSITIKEAMQQILDIRMAIGNLNSTISKMTTLVALIFIEKFIIGVIILIMNRVYTPWAWTYRIAFALLWFLIIVFILRQVARLNSKSSKFSQIALSAKVYGYHASNRQELDSFLLFVSNAKLRAKLFGVPLKPSLILGSTIIIVFTIIILFQTSVITTPHSFF